MADDHPTTGPRVSAPPPIFDPSRLYHVGVCVHSVAETAKFYEENFGIGPFWFREVSYDNATYFGETSGYRGKRGFAQMGPMLLELIELVDGRTIHESFLKEKGEGLHHLGFEVDNLEESMAEAKRQGFAITQYFRREDGTGFAYLDSDRVGGTIFELVERPRG
jgi:catechol 2,3-dioxygenase-like lactoylglutathione lyase family enzyme